MKDDKLAKKIMDRRSKLEKIRASIEAENKRKQKAEQELIALEKKVKETAYKNLDMALEKSGIFFEDINHEKLVQLIIENKLGLVDKYNSSDDDKISSVENKEDCETNETKEEIKVAPKLYTAY